jgi:hypothetical protein
MVKSWDRIFQKVFAAATPPVHGGHPHRFRDTPAVSLLLKGVSTEIDMCSRSRVVRITCSSACGSETADQLDDVGIHEQAEEL